MTGLVEALVEAACNAIRAERPAILHEPARLRNVMLELEVRNLGTLIDGRCWIEKKAKTARGEGTDCGRSGRQRPLV
jgi:hypothetical protein